MKDLHISWNDIKNTPQVELTALLRGLNNYNILHAFDCYSSDYVREMAKKNPTVRSDYGKSMEMKERYGMRKKHTSFKELIG